MKKEEWKETQFPTYFISSHGRLKKQRKDGTEFFPKLRIDKTGRFRLMVGKRHGVRKVLKIHIAVAIAFHNHVPCGYNKVVDHKDNNPLNNHKDNLQITSQRDNTSKRKITYSSKYVGVCWASSKGLWKASIHIDRRLHLGYSKDEKEMAALYQLALKNINLYTGDRAEFVKHIKTLSL